MANKLTKRHLEQLRSKHSEANAPIPELVGEPSLITDSLLGSLNAKEVSHVEGEERIYGDVEKPKEIEAEVSEEVIEVEEEEELAPAPVDTDESEGFRKKKNIEIAKLPEKVRKARIADKTELENLLVASKKEIYNRSNKRKAIKKGKVNKEYIQELDRLYLEKVKALANHIMLFVPAGRTIPMPEVNWAITNEITGLQKVYKNLPKPFVDIDKSSYCDALVWSCRYLFEMIYDNDRYTLDYLKLDSYHLAEEMFDNLRLKNAIGMERSQVELMNYMVEKYAFRIEERAAQMR